MEGGKNGIGKKMELGHSGNSYIESVSHEWLW
jgi:hypothetical protein